MIIRNWQMFHIHNAMFGISNYEMSRFFFLWTVSFLISPSCTATPPWIPGGKGAALSQVLWSTGTCCLKPFIFSHSLGASQILQEWERLALNTSLAYENAAGCPMVGRYCSFTNHSLSGVHPQCHQYLDELNPKRVKNWTASGNSMWQWKIL